MVFRDASKWTMALVLALHGLVIWAAMRAAVMPDAPVLPVLQGVLVPMVVPNPVATTPKLEPVTQPIAAAPPKSEPRPENKPKPIPRKSTPSRPRPVTPEVTSAPREPPPPPAVSRAASAPPAETRAAEAQSMPVVPPRIDASQLSNPAPSYPRLSRKRGEQGEVMLEVLIMADGSVGEMRVKASSGYPRLDEAALEAVKQWRYIPARQGEKAIAYWYLQPIVFALN